MYVECTARMIYKFGSTHRALTNGVICLPIVQFVQEKCFSKYKVMKLPIFHDGLDFFYLEPLYTYCMMPVVQNLL